MARRLQLQLQIRRQLPEYRKLLRGASQTTSNDSNSLDSSGNLGRNWTAAVSQLPALTLLHCAKHASDMYQLNMYVHASECMSSDDADGLSGSALQYD